MQADRDRACSRFSFRRDGCSEANPPYELTEFDRRQAAIHRATQTLVAQNGHPALAAMRASAVEEFMAVFGNGSQESRDDYEAGVLGGVRKILQQYGAMHEGVLVAPVLTVRAFYKARWNSIHRQPFVEGFSPIELQAYWGWLALHGWGKPLQKREDALLAFRDAGGFGTQEAAALFDLLEGHPERASASLERLYAASGELRLRNLALGALYATLLPMGSP